MFEKLAGRVNVDAALVRRGRLFSGAILLASGDECVRVSVAAGRIEAVEPVARPMPAYRFAVRAGAEAWERFRAPVPEPGYHDLFAMTKSGEAVIDGDITELMRHLRYFKELLAVLRHDG